MTDELREKAKAFRINSTSKFRPDYMLSTNMAEQLMAMFAAECVRADRERAGNLKQECDHVYERLSWILAACTIDRDAKNEIEALLK